MFILKQLRRKKNMSQTDLAKIVGVSLRTIQLYEKRDANIPIKNLTKIAEHFDQTIAALYSYEANDLNGSYGSHRILSEKHNQITPMAHGKYLITVPLISGELQAAYADRFGEKGFLESLDKIGFVVGNILDTPCTAFELTNSSMDNGRLTGVPNSAIVLGRLLSKNELAQIVSSNNRAICLLVYDTGVMCKEIVAYDEQAETIICHSLNDSPEYADFTMQLADVRQIFEVVKKQID
ncbi:helix-turn-helix transcriptional regulator [Flavobacteriaceae bacterium 3-367]